MKSTNSMSEVRVDVLEAFTTIQRHYSLKNKCFTINISAGSCAEAGGGEKWKHQWERLQASVNQFCPETPPRHAGGDVEKSSDPEYQEEHFLDKKLGASCSD
eukprot:g8591.t1